MGGEEVSGEIFGVLFALKQLADQVGMTRVLGPSEEGRLALFFPHTTSPLRKTDPFLLIKANPRSAQSIVGWSEALKGVAAGRQG
jgi:hypothetical protein